MKRSSKPRLAKVASAEAAFAIIEAGVAEIVARIAEKRRATKAKVRPRKSAANAA